MSKFELNPFNRSALKDSSLLAGRTNELRLVRFILRNSSSQKNRFKHLLITGNRGVGKTSFLNIIESESNTYNLIPIRIDLTESNSINSNEFYWNLFNQATKAVFRLDLLGGKNGEIDIAIQKLIISGDFSDRADWIFQSPILRYNYLKNSKFPFEFTSFIEDLSLIIKEIRESKSENFDEKTKLLFLIDEAQHIYHKSQIIEELRYIIQQPELGIGFVFSGDSSYLTSVWEEVFGGTHRDFEILNLNYFNDMFDVVDYFTKSLSSVDWTTKEIEETLFYRFHQACFQIFTLTSGKPAWINVIASKMFERCMRAESSIMKFDKQAQEDVKHILTEGGVINNSIIDYINGLSNNLTKWLIFIFASEFSTLKQVYFYAKFIIPEQSFINIEEYKRFCNELIDKGIILLLFKPIKKDIGYSYKEESDVLDIPYFIIGEESDKLKQWLQISSGGQFHFSAQPPAISFVNHINSELVNEGNKVTSFWFELVDSEENIVRLDTIIEKINNRSFHIDNYAVDQVRFIYKLSKKLVVSKIKQVLFISLKNLKSEKVRIWSVFNTDERGSICGFYNNLIRIDRFKKAVQKFNTDQEDYLLEISVLNLVKPDIDFLQELIISTNDSKKIQFLIDDKHKELIQNYVEKNDKKASLKVANFFKNLFESGHDLNLTDLNNTAYVYIMLERFEIAMNFLLEAKRKIQNNHYEHDELDIIPLILYNFSILQFKKNNLNFALNGFRETIEFIKDNDVKDTKASVLHILRTNELNEIFIEEVKEDNPEKIQIQIEIFAINNIKILEDYFLNI